MSKGLYQAVLDNRYRQVQLLVSSGLSPNVPNDQGQSPLVASLHIEDERRRKRMFEYLCRHGANCAAYDRSTERDLFTWACFLDRTHGAMWVMRDQGGSIDFRRKDTSGRTALHYCAVNGNVEILDKIVEYMKNYGIPVDIKDVDGFTPYILALRMGHKQCAGLLRHGGASPNQMDSKNLRSCDDWAWISDREKSFLVRKSQDKKVAMYKTLGRLPALKAAKYKTSDVKIVASKKDKNLLDSKEMNASNRKSTQMFKQHTWLDFEKTKQKQLSKSLPDFKLEPVDENASDPKATKKEKPHSHKKLSYQMPSRSLDMTLTLLNLSQGAPPGGKFGSQVESDLSISESFNDIMRLLEQQCSHSYRPHVKPSPPQPKQEKPIKDTNKKRRGSMQLQSSIMAKRMARRFIASRERRVSAASSQAQKTLFPSIVEES